MFGPIANRSQFLVPFASFQLLQEVDPTEFGRRCCLATVKNDVNSNTGIFRCLTWFFIWHLIWQVFFNDVVFFERRSYISVFSLWSSPETPDLTRVLPLGLLRGTRRKVSVRSKPGNAGILNYLPRSQNSTKILKDWIRFTHITQLLIISLTQRPYVS